MGGGDTEVERGVSRGELWAVGGGRLAGECRFSAAGFWRLEIEPQPIDLFPVPVVSKKVAGSEKWESLPVRLCGFALLTFSNQRPRAISPITGDPVISTSFRDASCNLAELQHQKGLDHGHLLWGGCCIIARRLRKVFIITQDLSRIQIRP